MTNFMPATKKKAGLTRSFWLKQLHRWHWISAALSLVGMLLFAVTGITLNHAADIEASPTVTEREARLPPPLLKALPVGGAEKARSEEHTSELQSLMRTSYAVFCLKKKTQVYQEAHCARTIRPYTPSAEHHQRQYH